MADYPASVKNFLELQDGIDSIIAQHPNERGDEITAIQTLIGALGSSQSYNESLKNLLKNYLAGCKVISDTVSQIIVEAGEIAIPDASGNIRWRRNTSDTTVTWADIDTGSEASSTRYYVYAVADSSGTEFTILISTSASAPSGATYYRKIGSFYNNSSSNIEDVLDDNFMLYQKPGLIIPCPQSGVPDGAILCYGQATVGTTNDPTLQRLYNAIGTTYGGTGATDFCVPDMRGRAIVGLDNMGGSSANRIANAQADSLGGVMGAETHTLAVGELPVTILNGKSLTGSGSNTCYSVATSRGSSADYTTSDAANESFGSGNSHNNVQPTIFQNYVILK